MKQAPRHSGTRDAADTKRRERPPQPAVGPSSNRVFWLASLLFVLSGATALAYEVIWFKRFSQLWGNSALAAGAVVGAFLLGLGVGAYVIGRFSDRVRSPMLWYGLSEAGIALFAVALPFEIGWLGPLNSVFYRLSGGQSLILSLLRVAPTLVLLGPPCFLMGGTLPLLIRSFASSGTAAERHTAWFYAINTLGAASGSYLTGFHLLPSIGLAWTNSLAVATDIGIGAAAAMLARQWPGQPAPGRALERQAAPRGRLPRWVINPSALLAGCASLILQMVWARQLALILGGSTYAFAGMLFVILLGIGLGSLACDRWLKLFTKPFPGAALLTLALGASAAACQKFIPHLTALAGVAMSLRASALFNGAISVYASALLELPAALGMGVLFPVFVAMVGESEAGSDVGEVYAWNTFGALIGALATPLVLVPNLGKANAVALAVVMYAAIVLIIIAASGARRDYAARIVTCAAAVALMLFSRTEFDPLIVDGGSYLYGYPPAGGAEQKLLYFSEGAAVDVMVAEAADGRSLRVNGKVDASSFGDMPTQLGLAYLPRFLRPAAKDVLVIGFGSGTTSGASLLFPGTRVLCSEIEPAVFGASSQFAAVNHSPERSPRFSIAFDDARSYLQETDRKFDLIISEPSNPWLAGVSNLFTTQFYECALRRLKPGGILAQWLQLYNLSPSDYAMVMRTVMGVFPHLAVLRTGDGDTIVLASDAPIGATRAGLKAMQSQVDSVPAVQSDLRTYLGGSDIFRLLFVNMVLDEVGVRNLVGKDGSRMVNTDLNIRLEYDAPRSLFHDTTKATMGSILAAAEPAQYARAFEALGGTKDESTLFATVANSFARAELRDMAARICELGFVRNPQDPALLAGRLVWSQTDQAFFENAITTIIASSPSVANEVGSAYTQFRQFDRAIEVFERLVSANPNSAVIWTNLSTVYLASGARDKALEAIQKAYALDPFNNKIREAYQEQMSPTATH